MTAPKPNIMPPDPSEALGRKATIAEDGEHLIAVLRLVMAESARNAETLGTRESQAVFVRWLDNLSDADYNTVAGAIEAAYVFVDAISASLLGCEQKRGEATGAKMQALMLSSLIREGGAQVQVGLMRVAKGPDTPPQTMN